MNEAPISFLNQPRPVHQSPFLFGDALTPTLGYRDRDSETNSISDRVHATESVPGMRQCVSRRSGTARLWS
jgi:hypothetical protein